MQSPICAVYLDVYHSGYLPKKCVLPDYGLLSLKQAGKGM
jgi:hypothetical protein